jgi:hypothetical protein
VSRPTQDCFAGKEGASDPFVAPKPQTSLGPKKRLLLAAMAQHRKPVAGGKTDEASRAETPLNVDSREGEGVFGISFRGHGAHTNRLVAHIPSVASMK